MDGQPHLIQVERGRVVNDLDPEEDQPGGNGFGTQTFVAEQVEQRRAGLLDLLVVLLDLQHVVQRQTGLPVDFGDPVQYVQRYVRVFGNHELRRLDQVKQEEVYYHHWDEQDVRDRPPIWDFEEDQPKQSFANSEGYLNSDAEVLARLAQTLFVDEGVVERDGWISTESGQELPDGDHADLTSRGHKYDPQSATRPGRVHGLLPAPVIGDIGKQEEPDQRPNVHQGLQDGDDVLVFADVEFFEGVGDGLRMVRRDVFLPLGFVQGTHVILAVLARPALAFEVALLEEESAAQQHPRNTEPLQIEYHEADPLVAALTVDFVEQVVQGGDHQRHVLWVGLVQKRLGVVGLHWDLYTILVLYRFKCVGLRAGLHSLFSTTEI